MKKYIFKKIFKTSLLTISLIAIGLSLESCNQDTYKNSIEKSEASSLQSETLRPSQKSDSNGSENSVIQTEPMIIGGKNIVNENNPVQTKFEIISAGLKNLSSNINELSILDNFPTMIWRGKVKSVYVKSYRTIDESERENSYGIYTIGNDIQYNQKTDEYSFEEEPVDDGYYVITFTVDSNTIITYYFLVVTNNADANIIQGSDNNINSGSSEDTSSNGASTSGETSGTSQGTSSDSSTGTSWGSDSSTGTSSNGTSTSNETSGTSQGTSSGSDSSTGTSGSSDDDDDDTSENNGSQDESNDIVTNDEND